MEKTKYEMKAEVETANVLPKTLVAETQLMPMGGATIPMYAVYGRTDDDRASGAARSSTQTRRWPGCKRAECSAAQCAAP
jgi:hypothetical protein